MKNVIVASLLASLFSVTGLAYGKCVEKESYIVCCGPFACHVFPK